MRLSEEVCHKQTNAASVDSELPMTSGRYYEKR